jgi:cell division protein FtsX
MKIAIFFILSTISFGLSASTFRHIQSFQDSSSISSIAQFLKDASEDVSVSTRISDKKMKVRDIELCTSSTSQKALKEAEIVIKSVLKLYPDEELPFEEALGDLENYLDNREFTRCTITQIKSNNKIQSIYYFDYLDEVHLKLDIISLVK